MFPTKTSRDVGIVDGVSDATGSSMEKPTGGKVQEQGVQPTMTVSITSHVLE